MNLEEEKQVLRQLQANNDMIVMLQERLQAQGEVISLQDSKIQKLDERHAQDKAVVETWQRISESDDKVEMSAVAKMLAYDGIGRNKLFRILRDEQILRYNNEPYQSFMDRGYFGIIEQEVSTSYGNTIVNKKTIVTQKGIDYIRKTLDKLGY